MSILPCSDCGCCDDCLDNPTQLVVEITYPEGDGVMATPDAEGADPISTTCTPPHDYPLQTITTARVVVNDEGSGYWRAPTPSADFGEQTVGGVEAIVIINRGSGYTSTPTVTITGDGSGATAEATVDSGKIASVTITNKGSGYTTDPTVTVTGGGGSGASLSGRVASRECEASVRSPIVSVTVNNGGSGYRSAPTVNFSHGGGQAIATVRGPVDLVTVTSGGAGYESAPEVLVDGGSGFQGTATLTGYVSAVAVTDGGSGYSTAPTVSFSGGGGSGATATASRRFFLDSISVTSGGSGYTSPPTVSVSGAHATASCTAVVEGGAVVAVVINSTGSGSTSSSTPTVSFSGGGGSGATATATITGRVTAVNVTNGGSGYTSPPTVSFSGSGGAEATASILQRVGSVSVDSGGCGYPPSPAVRFVGGGATASATATARINGSVTSIRLTRARELTQTINSNNQVVGLGWPTITFSGGGGGTGASATPNFAGRLTNVACDGGDELSEPPTIVLTGPGGGATAEATIADGQVTAINVTDGGSNYTAAPTVTIKGGGGVGAAATAQVVDGEVTAITVNTPGCLYTSAPKVVIQSHSDAGSAEAFLTWKREDTEAIDIQGCYTVLSREVCMDASADSFPASPCVGCGSGGEQFSSTRTRFGEGLYWSIIASTQAGYADGSIDTRQVNFYSGREFEEDGWERYTSYATVFPGEMIYVYVERSWSVGDSDGTAYSDRYVSQTMYVKRLYSRVAPSVVYGLDSQPAAAINARIIPTLKQGDDAKGDPLWWISGFTLEDGGANLYVEPGLGDVATILRPTESNFPKAHQSRITYADVEVSYAPPEIGGYSVTGVAFTSEPDFSFAFSPTGDAGEYELTAASVVAGGATTAANGTYSLVIESLDAGYDIGAYTLPQLTITVTGGTVASVQITNAGLLVGPAVVSSVAIWQDDTSDVEFISDESSLAVRNRERTIIGASNFEVTTTYSEPTVTATTAPEGGTPATLSVTLAEETGGSRTYWRVDAVSVVSGGSGHVAPVEILFEATGSFGVEAIAAVAVGVLPDREEPTLEATAGGSGAVLEISYTESDDEWAVDAVAVTDGGTGYTNGESVTFTLGQDDNGSGAEATITTVLAEPTVTATVPGGSGAALTVVLASDGMGAWTISSVTIDNAGTGYAEFETVAFSGGDQESSGAFADISVDENGAITAVNVYSGGQFYDDTGVIDSVAVTSGGAYYKQETHIESVTVTYGGQYFDREFTPTGTAIEKPVCIGQVTGEWDELPFKVDESLVQFGPYEVGDAFTYEHQIGCDDDSPGTSGLTMNRTRRCPLPEFDISIQ